MAKPNSLALALFLLSFAACSPALSSPPVLLSAIPSMPPAAQPAISTPSPTITTTKEPASSPRPLATVTVTRKPLSTNSDSGDSSSSVRPSFTPSPSDFLSPDFLLSAPVTAILPGHFLLARPIAPPGNSLIDASYRYGSTQRGKRVLHHGVEMENDLGTPVLAAANGVVVVAGDDQETAYGPQTNFYGQLVILKHEFSGLAQPVFSLYGHLSQVSVRVGQTVKVGQIIGQVGMTGWAIGYHLHFEVRLGENRYENTRNPELWLQPATESRGGSDILDHRLPLLADPPLQEAVAPDKNGFSGSAITGAFAGRIVDINGQPLRIAKIVLLPKNAPLVKNRIFVESYDDQSMKRTNLTIQDLPEDYVLVPYSHQTLGRDDLWREDFAISNLPAGKYVFSFTVKKVYTLEIEIRPGQLTFITFPLVRD